MRYLAQWGPLAARAVADDLLRDATPLERLLDRLLLAGRAAIVQGDAYGAPCYAG